MPATTDTLVGGKCTDPGVNPEWWLIDNIVHTTTRNIQALYLCGVCPVKAECYKLQSETPFTGDSGAVIAAARLWGPKGERNPTHAMKTALINYLATLGRKSAA